MMRLKNSSVLVTLAFMFLSGQVVSGSDYHGTVRTGYVFTDIEGNRGVHQPTYNLYDGVMLSLEHFRYNWDNGMRLSADLTNPALENRHANVSLGRLGWGSITLHHNSYRRTYNFDGSSFTRRKTTSGSAWIQPIKHLKLFGDMGFTDKSGTLRTLVESPVGQPAHLVDYLNRYYHAGVEIKYRRSYGRFEYRASDYTDDASGSDDRSTRRLGMSIYTPMPKFERIVLGAGFHHFENTVENKQDTLSANTVWGVARYSDVNGYQVRYSFIFDRSSRTEDLTATDNILQTLSVGKAWKNRGGIIAGYGYRINDDIRVERSGNEYSVSAWLAPSKQMSLRAGIGWTGNNVDSGRTLTGDRDYSRHWLLARYRFAEGTIRLRIDNSHRSNPDIGSESDFIRGSLDVSTSSSSYGNMLISYSFGEGEYSNSSGTFDFSEHALSGDAFSSEYRGIQLGFGGSYYRARQDLDIEAFSIRLTGKYRFYQNACLEIVYSAHNFDNFNDLPAPYLEYYTANVVEVSIAYEI